LLERSSKSALLLDSATVNETPSLGVYRMMGLATCEGQVSFCQQEGGSGGE